MVNKFDVFFEIAKKGSTNFGDLARLFSSQNVNKNSLYYHINTLIKEGLIIKEKNTLLSVHSEKNQILFSILEYCINNNIDYGFYLEESTVNFLENRFLDSKKEISVNTKTKIIHKLSKDSFLVLFTKKPYHFMIMYHTLFEQILSFFLNKKIEFDFYVNEKIISLNLSRIRKMKFKHQNEEEVKFLHTSLFLEGNLLTLRETIKLLKDEELEKGEKYKDVAEAKGYSNAIKYMQTVKKIDINEIKKIHKICMQHENFSGEFRKENVHIKNNPDFKTADFKDIETKLSKLISEINSFQSKKVKNICDFASHIHNEFQHIHPFLDGNSRTTRLLSVWFFKKCNYDFTIPIGFTSIYMRLTKGHQKREDEKLSYLFFLILLYLSTRFE
ncbi:MAG: Fic family protein [Candidatus Woesearchaeota archaeon]|jgi:fido (protein-threonine AMPylation protein)